MIDTIIIDDEEDALIALKIVIEKYCPQLNIVELCTSPIKGAELIKKHRPKLVFLDIQMPDMSGFDLLQSIEDIDFDVIFVTAFEKYAIKAIKFSALDYLLKPVDVDELISAIRKIEARERPHRVSYDSLLNNIKFGLDKITSIAIPNESEIVIQKLIDIIYLEADSNYTVLHLTNSKKMTVSKTLKDFEQILSRNDFCRIHHSTLVNLAHVKKYVKGEGGFIIVSNGAHLNVSRRKKNNLVMALHKI